MVKLVSEASQLDVRVRNGQVAWAHIEAEYADVVEDILATLVPEEPYAYTVSPNTNGPVPEGSIPYQPFVSSKADLRESYENLHRFSIVRRMQAVAEIRGDWYVFFYGLGEGLVKPTNEIVYSPTAVLFPTMGKNGITGELFWTRTGAGTPYTGGREGPLAAETAVLDRHEALLDAFRKADAGAVAALFHPDAQTGIRDYVNDTGTLAGMHSAEEVKQYLEQFFARYHVHDVSLIQRLATDWFVFAELLWVVEDKANPGQKQTFYTAEHAELRPDGLFASRIGHGTDPKKI